MAEVFQTILKNSGIPTTETEMRNYLFQQLSASGSTLTNSGNYAAVKQLFDALAVTPALAFVNNMTNTVMPAFFRTTATELALDEIGVSQNNSRLQATKATGNLLFTKTDITAEATIPAGIIITTEQINNQTFSVITTSETTIEAGVESGLVSVEATQTGSAYNLAEDYYTILTSEVNNIDSVTNQEDWIVTAGTDIETDDNYRQRLINQFSNQSEWFTYDAYKNIIARLTGTRIHNIFFSNDSPRGQGSNNAYIMLETGTATTTVLSEVNNYINRDEHHGPGDDLQVFELPNRNVDLTLTIRYPDGAVTDAINQNLSDVENFIRCVFRENNFYPDATKIRPYQLFSISKLQQELHRQFELIESINITQSDIDFGLEKGILNNLNITQGA